MALVRAVRCSRTGMMYPPDYVELWGIRYGIGLGPIPISEALVNDYNGQITQGRSSESSMHPVGISGAQVDVVDVDEKEFKEKEAILAIDDPYFEKRGKIMREKQLLKSSKLQSMFPEEHRAVLEKQTIRT